MNDNEDDNRNRQVFRLHVDGEGWVTVRMPEDAGAGVATVLRKIADLVEMDDVPHIERTETT